MAWVFGFVGARRGNVHGRRAAMIVGQRAAARRGVQSRKQTTGLMCGRRREEGAEFDPGPLNGNDTKDSIDTSKVEWLQSQYAPGRDGVLNFKFHHFLVNRRERNRRLPDQEATRGHPDPKYASVGIGRMGWYGDTPRIIHRENTPMYEYKCSFRLSPLGSVLM